MTDEFTSSGRSGVLKEVTEGTDELTSLGESGVLMTRREALRRLGVLGLGVTAASALAPGRLMSAHAQARPVTIRFNHTDGRGGEGFFFAEKFKELVEQRSHGRITVHTFHTGELGAERPMYGLLQAGAIEMGRTGSLIISVVAPEYATMDMPYVFRSQQHLRNVLRGPVGGALHRDILTRKGIRVVAIVNRTPRHLTTRERAVRTPADLRGLRVRVPEIPVYVAAWRALGASPTPMPFPEVFTALRMGAIDGQENPVGTIFGNAFFDVQRFLIKTAHVRGNGWMVASERFWQGLIVEDRQLLQQAATDAATHADEQVAATEQDIERKLRERGMTIIEPDPRPFSDIVWRDVPPQFRGAWKRGLLEQIQRTAG